MYQRFGSALVREVISGMDAAHLIARGRRSTFASTKHLSAAHSRVVEAARLLRHHVTTSNVSSEELMRDFDDILANLQTVCNNQLHNATMALG